MTRIIHIFSQWARPRMGDRKRHSEAAASWHHAHRTAGEWMLVPVDEARMARNAKTVLGDPFPLPFVRDVIDMGIEQAHANADDLVVWSNDDICFAEDIANDLLETRLGWASRRDFMAVPRRCTKASIAKGYAHPGVDSFSCPVALWTKIRQDMPDMFIARSRFDLVLRDVLKRNGGKEIVNVLAHSLHHQDWIASEQEPAGIHNIKCYDEYVEKHGQLWIF